MRARDRLRRVAKPREPSVWVVIPTLLDEAVVLGLDGNSFDDIARILSKKFEIELTRNAVISKFDRSAIVKPKASGDTPKRAAPARWRMDRAKPDEKRVWSPDPDILALLAVVVDTVHPPVAPDARRGVQDIDDRQCRWPIGDPQKAGFHFCAQNSAPGLPYCDGHAEVAYAVERRRTRKSVVVLEIETVD